MGQKTNPIGNRLGIIRGWNSNWYGGRDYGDKLAEDNKIRKYINVRLSKASVSNIIIERTLKLITVTITTARPGIIIGKGGQEVDKLKEEYNSYQGRSPESNGAGVVFMPYLMAESVQTIAEGTMAPKVAVKSRFALVEAGHNPETQYVTLTFSNLSL